MLSVIIPTYHRNDLLALCLNCLKPGVQTLDSEHYEVIVSDDGRESTAQHMLADQYPWVRWVQGPQKGPAANRNAGARQAKGEWLVFTDDDCLPDAKWLVAYFDAIQIHRTLTVLEGRTIADRPQQRYDEESPINETGGNLWSCNFAILATTFNKLSGFDESFPIAGGEDMDFNNRVRLNHIKSEFLTNAIIYHPWRQVRFQDKNKVMETYAILRTKYPDSYNVKTLLYNHLIGFPGRLILLSKFRFKGFRTFFLREFFMFRVITGQPKY